MACLLFCSYSAAVLADATAAAVAGNIAPAAADTAAAAILAAVAVLAATVLAAAVLLPSTRYTGGWQT